MKCFTGKELEEKMTSLLDQNREAHFFCDEMPIGKDGLRQAFLIDFSEKMSPKKYLWIAWNNKSTPTDELKTGKYSLKMLLCGEFKSLSSD